MDKKIIIKSNEEIELLVIFFSNSIELIFYCDKKNREMTIHCLNFNGNVA